MPSISLHISQYGHRAWRIQDGFFNGAPTAITQTADGYIWIGTTSGLFRFDGIRFVTWNDVTHQKKHLESEDIFSLLAARDDALWIGAATGGLFRWKDHSSRHIRPKAVLKARSTLIPLVKSNRGAGFLRGMLQRFANSWSRDLMSMLF